MIEGNVVHKSIAALWPLFVEQAKKLLNAEQERLSEEGYLMDSDECIQVLQEASPQYAETSAPVSDYKIIPVEPTDTVIELIAERARVCGGGALEIYDAIVDSASVVPGEPAGWQSRFTEAGDKWDAWSPCTREHYELVRSNPQAWAGYEVREIFAAPQLMAQGEPTAWLVTATDVLDKPYRVIKRTPEETSRQAEHLRSVGCSVIVEPLVRYTAAYPGQAPAAQIVPISVDTLARIAGKAEALDHGGDGCDDETARSVAADLRGLIVAYCKSGANHHD